MTLLMIGAHAIANEKAKDLMTQQYSRNLARSGHLSRA